MIRLELLRSDEPAVARAARLTATIAAEVLAFVLVTVLFPLLFLAGLAIDLVLWAIRRKPLVAIRMVAFLWWFLFGEIRGLLGLGWAWAVTGGPFRDDSPARRRRVFDLQVSWAVGHLAGIRVLFGLTFEVEGDELVEPAPAIYMIRHASIIDNALPATVISRPHGIDLRYVLKHELSKIPTLDLGGHWIPTCFVRRASANAGAEVTRVRSLGKALGEHDGVLIYPEGTRCTAEKLARAQAKLAESDPEVGLLAARLRHLLPPRLGGPLALLDEAGNADVVICGHVGLDGFEYISDVWSGALVGTTVRVRFWRHARAEVPESEEDRIAWIYEQWQTLDDWIGERQDASRPRMAKAGAARA